MEKSKFELLIEDLYKRKLPLSVKKSVELILDKKGTDVSVLKLKQISDVTDYLVICTGKSGRQNQAIADELRKRLSKEMRMKPFNVEGKGNTDWILLDYIDFVVHIFNEESRAKFSLEKLWMDAKRYDFSVDSES